MAASYARVLGARAICSYRARVIIALRDQNKLPLVWFQDVFVITMLSELAETLPGVGKIP